MNSAISLKSLLSEVEESLSPTSDYIEYLMKIKEFYGDELHISVDEMLEEIPFWRYDNFVWPTVHVDNGNPVFRWTAGATRLRLARDPVSANYNVYIWQKDSHLKDVKAKPGPKNEAQIIKHVDHTYRMIEREVMNSGSPWKERIIDAIRKKEEETKQTKTFPSSERSS